MVKGATFGYLSDERIHIYRRATLIQHDVACSSNDSNETQTNDETDQGVALPLMVGQWFIHNAKVLGGKVVVGPSLIQHPANGEVSCNAMSVGMNAKESEGICRGQSSYYSCDSSQVSK